MIVSSSALRFVGLLVSLTLIDAACRPSRTIKLIWDAPEVLPNGYRIVVDEGVVMDIPPPPVDPSCKCLTVSVTVPKGQHTVKVVAYNQFGSSPPSAVAILK